MGAFVVIIACVVVFVVVVVVVVVVVTNLTFCVQVIAICGKFIYFGLKSTV